MHRRIVERLGARASRSRGDARIDDVVEVEPDATIEAGVVLRGKTTRRAAAPPSTSAACSPNAESREGAQLKPYSVVTDRGSARARKIGPFSHLRPESDIGEDAHIGNFVETKKTRSSAGAKANHLAYLGDGVVGEGANIGAGTIFCNYDGFAAST